ncbi:MAG: dihydrolipoyl dehydrogenase [Verrucomicrobiota bacterium]
MENFDVIVIGGGPGGYPAAIRAAQLGAEVALIEKADLGGTCLNRGCIPTKTLIAAVGQYAQIQDAQKIGIEVKEANLDYGKTFKHKEKVVKNLRKGIEQLLKANGVTVYNGEAEFKDHKALKITAADGKQTEIKGDKIIIATGSESLMPGFLPNHDRILDSTAFLELKELPQSMLVVGGGYIGCELACMAAMAGVEVTIVEMLDDILMLLDEDVRKVIRKDMEKRHGIRILTGTPLEEVKADNEKVTATVKDEKITTDVLLAAVGRRPVAQSLKLGNTGLKLDEYGQIPVDKYNRTEVGGIYAVGDVNGIIQLAHAATSQGVRAAEHAGGKQEVEENEELVPGVIFTSPEVAVVGLSEHAAEQEERAVKTGTFPFKALGRAVAANESDGFVKWIADAETGQLLGAQAVGPHATDLIAEATVAIRGEFTARELGETIHAHPTFNEAWMEAAHAVDGQAIHQPPAKSRD